MSEACKPETRARLRELTSKVPASVNDGSYNLSVDFKAAVVKGIKLLGRGNLLREHDAAAHISDMQKFWRAP